MEAPVWDHATLRRPEPGDGRRLDLRPGPGRAQPDPLRAEVLCRTKIGATLTDERRTTTDARTARRATVEFKLDGQTVTAFEGETILQGRRAPRRARSRTCATATACAPDGNCRACVVEIDGERTLAPSCCRSVTPGMEVQAQQRARASRARRWCWRCCWPTCPRQRLQVERRDGEPRGAASTANSATGPRAWASAVRPALSALRREQPAADLSHPAMAVNLDACIQCTRCVRACREEQVNDVIGMRMRGAHSADRVRPGRPDGRQHLRGLRRMRAGLPDRRADAQDPDRLAGGGQDRSIRSARSAASAACSPTTSRQQDRQRRRPRRPGQPRPAVRQGPLRLRLRAPPAAPDQAADPQARRAQGPGATDAATRPTGATVFREATWDEALDLAAGRLKAPARHARQEGAGRLRLGQGQQRRGLPVPEAGAHRLRQQQRRPLHAPVPCLQRGGAARRRGLGRGEQPGQRRGARRADPRDRLQPDRQPPGGRHLDEERRASAAPRSCWPTRASPTSAATPGARCSSSADTDVAHAQRDDPHGDRRRPGRRRSSSRDRVSNFEALKENVQGLQPRGAWRRSAASRPRRMREVARAFATGEGRR